MIQIQMPVQGYRAIQQTLWRLPQRIQHDQKEAEATMNGVMIRDDARAWRPARPFFPLDTASRTYGFREPWEEWERSATAVSSLEPAVPVTAPVLSPVHYQHVLTPFQLQLLEKMGRSPLAHRSKESHKKPFEPLVDAHNPGPADLAALSIPNALPSAIRTLKAQQEQGQDQQQEQQRTKKESEEQREEPTEDRSHEVHHDRVFEYVLKHSAFRPSVAQSLRQHIQYGRFAPADDDDHRHMLDYGSSLPLSVAEVDDAYLISVDMPGVKRNDLELSLQSDPIVASSVLLTLAGQRTQKVALPEEPTVPASPQADQSNNNNDNKDAPANPQEEQEKSKPARPKTHTASFKFARSIRLPSYLTDVDKISAQLEDGVLTVSVPREENQSNKTFSAFSRKAVPLH